MSRTSILTAAVLVAAFTASSAFAQQGGVRVAGKVAAVDGSSVTIKQQQGDDVKVSLTPTVVVFTAGKASLSDVKQGSFVGVGATPQADGTQKAIRVNIFAESQRGTGEGHRPWDRPNTTMTNATVDTTVSSVDGQVLTVKYKDGEKKIIIGPDATILSNLEGTKADIKVGANIAIPAATKKPDGTFEAARVTIGRGDFTP
jgi:hypothetical protein